MAKVRDILDAKGRTVHSLGPEATVLDALRLMALHDIGAVVVLEDSLPVGIFTERHYARDVFLKERASPTTPLSEVMSRELVPVSPDQSVEACMAIMTEKRFRHLPVLEDRQLAGVISIGDLLKSVIKDREFDIDQLITYVQG